MEWVKLILGGVGGGLMLIISYITYLYKNNKTIEAKRFDQLKDDSRAAEERGKERMRELEDKVNTQGEKIVRLESTSVTKEELLVMFDSKLKEQNAELKDFFLMFYNKGNNKN
jgi:hypothetical protein